MTTHTKRISEAFQRNHIKRVLIVDDAYDPPPIDEATTAALADILTRDVESSVPATIEIERQILEVAQEAAITGDMDSEALYEAYRELYHQFTVTRDSDIDPGGRFQARKGQALDELSPLSRLLQECGDQMDVQTAGLSGASNVYRNLRPQIVFLDYYLHASLDDIGYRDVAGLASARRGSLNILQELIGDASADDIPAVVLISSQEISDVDEYRHSVPGKAMMALRFGFLQKRTIRSNGIELEVDHKAADALLDTSQGYLLGKAVQGALHKWKIGAEAALEKFLNEVNDLHTKDFAYLLRFRLRDEAQPLDEYLLWLFGESFAGLIEESVDYRDSFLNLDPETDAYVEGALEGRIQTIAKMFHRVRVNIDRVRSWREHRLGDLFVRLHEHRAVVVITPDCDLVCRNSSPNAKSVLTMGGTLYTFDQTESAADDLLIIRDQPYSVLWDPKDLQTFPISGDGRLCQSHEFIGTLRPLYAQDTQRRALTDLSRVGLPVAPALGIHATARVWIRKTGGHYHEIVMEHSVTTVVPERAGKPGGGHRVLTARSFVHELLDKLSVLNREELNNRDKNSLQNLLAHEGSNRAYDALLRDGARLNSKAFLGIGVFVGSEARSHDGAPWLQILIDISSDTLTDFRVADPLG